MVEAVVLLAVEVQMNLVIVRFDDRDPELMKRVSKQYSALKLEGCKLEGCLYVEKGIGAVYKF